MQRLYRPDWAAALMIVHKGRSIALSTSVLPTTDKRVHVVVGNLPTTEAVALLEALRAVTLPSCEAVALLGGHPAVAPGGSTQWQRS